MWLIGPERGERGGGGGGGEWITAAGPRAPTRKDRRDRQPPPKQVGTSPVRLSNLCTSLLMAVSTTVRIKVTTTMCVEQLLRNNWSKRLSSFQSPSPRLYTLSLLGSLEGPAPPSPSWSRLDWPANGCPSLHESALHLHILFSDLAWTLIPNEWLQQFSSGFLNIHWSDVAYGAICLLLTLLMCSWLSRPPPLQVSDVTSSSPCGVQLLFVLWLLISDCCVLGFLQLVVLQGCVGVCQWLKQ